MSDLHEAGRIPKAFTEKLAASHSNHFEAVRACIQLSAKMLRLSPSTNLQRITGHFLASMTNSITAMAVLGRYGHGADAVRIGRGMFETLVSMKYLIARQKELKDYLDFDAVARWKRLQFYKANHPDVYAGFPANKKDEVEREYQRVRARFIGRNGKPRLTWCNRPLSQMAEIAELADLYELFYPYASALHHASPMGLGMLVDGASVKIKPAPQLEHIGMALMAGIQVLVEAIRSYSKTVWYRLRDNPKTN